MDADERDIFQYLKTWGESFSSAMEICRRAGSKRKFHEDPTWAKPVLVRMAERGILESDLSGRYRIKPVPRGKHKQWVAPDVAKILEEGGETPEGVGSTSDFEMGDDEYYEGL
jgi:hypothetical protein